MTSFITKEDYEEPCCPLSAPGGRSFLPVGRMMEKLDEDLGKKDFAGAERHLRYWLSEAEYCGDERGRVAVLNELMGLCRKLDRRDEAVKWAEDAICAAQRAGYEDSALMGTTLINAATVYKAFGAPEKAMEHYEKAQTLCEKYLPGDDERLGGLYNNMALALCDLKRYEDAEKYYRLALSVMRKVEHGEGEAAITYCNLADLAAARYGEETGEKVIGKYLDRAQELLDTPGLPWGTNYAYICEKCGPVFDYYGYFLYAAELRKRAEKIYAGA